MRIKRLIVSKYKNVEGLNLKFENHLISLLVGKNGLGKSNLIEILALIFRELDQLETEQNFKDWAYAAGHFEYFIQYECRNSEMRILCREDKFEVSRRQKGSSDVFTVIDFNTFKRNRGEEYLPQYIIGYYSGENKRIRKIIRPYEELVWNELKKNEGFDKSFRKLFFAENYHAQLVLLTLLLYKGQTGNAEFQAKTQDLIDRFCSFTELEGINFALRQPSWYSRTPKQQVMGMDYLEENILAGSKVTTPFWGAKGKANEVISYFYNNAQSYTGYYDEESRIENLELNGINKVDLAVGIYEKFNHPINFFDALESLLQIEAIRTLQLSVKSKTSEITFDFTQLSEGEQQLITVLGLILITGKDDCLFLLDEPDTHLNPIWQRSYVQLLNDFNLNDDNSHIIVATHSPLIVQAAEEADVFLYKRTGDKIVVDDNDLKIHNWRIDQVLASEYFEFENTRPPQLDEFMKEREELLSKPELTAEDIEKIKSFQEAEELLPSGETLDDFKAMHLIHKTANRINQDDKNQ